MLLLFLLLPAVAVFDTMTPVPIHFTRLKAFSCTSFSLDDLISEFTAGSNIFIAYQKTNLIRPRKLMGSIVFSNGQNSACH